MHTHVLNTYNHTGERPQGCQVRKHAWRELLKLVPAKVQRAVATQEVRSTKCLPFLETVILI
jgi:hypothetical protein